MLRVGKERGKAWLSAVLQASPSNAFLAATRGTTSEALWVTLVAVVLRLLLREVRQVGDALAVP